MFAAAGAPSAAAGDAPLLRFLGSAHTTIEVSVYTFASERIASVLAADYDLEEVV